jgi:hypothetical protein
MSWNLKITYDNHNLISKTNYSKSYQSPQEKIHKFLKCFFSQFLWQIFQNHILQHHFSVVCPMGCLIILLQDNQKLCWVHTVMMCVPASSDSSLEDCIKCQTILALLLCSLKSIRTACIYSMTNTVLTVLLFSTRCPFTFFSHNYVTKTKMG